MFVHFDRRTWFDCGRNRIGTPPMEEIPTGFGFQKTYDSMAHRATLSRHSLAHAPFVGILQLSIGGISKQGLPRTVQLRNQTCSSRTVGELSPETSVLDVKHPRLLTAGSSDNCRAMRGTQVVYISMGLLAYLGPRQQIVKTAQNTRGKDTRY